MPERAKSRRKVFLGTQEISGYYNNLEIGFMRIGVQARFVTTHPHPFGYPQSHRNPWPARCASSAVLMHRRSSGLLRALAAGAYLISSVLLLLWTLPRFNTYIFAWGVSILPRNCDLRLLRLFGKTVVTVLGHGSEARPPYMSSPSRAFPLSAQQLRSLREETAAMAAKVRRVEKYSSHTVGLPTTAQFFESSFVDFYRLGLPTSAVDDGPVVRDDDDIVIVHVPSNPAVKGSAFIRACVEEIAKVNPRVRYVELSNRPHSEILDALRTAVLVVDQLWSDIPMAVVGTEAASLGTATVISGYAWPEWRARWKCEDLPPTILATPDTLHSDIERALADLESTRELGERAREYVLSRWSPGAVARNYLRMLDGDVPGEWIVDPATLRYGWGVGVEREDVREMVSGLVDSFGVDSLEWPAAVEVYGLADVADPRSNWN